jgi:hypothetical protein
MVLGLHSRGRPLGCLHSFGRDAMHWYRCNIGQHYRVRIELSCSPGGKQYWTSRIVFVSDRFPQGRLVADRFVENSELKLWSRICAVVRKRR